MKKVNIIVFFGDDEVVEIHDGTVSRLDTENMEISFSGDNIIMSTREIYDEQNKVP